MKIFWQLVRTAEWMAAAYVITLFILCWYDFTRPFEPNETLRESNIKAIRRVAVWVSFFAGLVYFLTR